MKSITAAVVILVAAVGLAISGAIDVAGDETADQIRDAQVKECVRTLGERRDAVARDRDLAEFASDAADAREADGDLEPAEKYRTTARRARARAVRTRHRMLLGLPPEQARRMAREERCRAAYK